MQIRSNTQNPNNNLSFKQGFYVSPNRLAEVPEAKKVLAAVDEVVSKLYYNGYRYNNKGRKVGNLGLCEEGDDIFVEPLKNHLKITVIKSAEKEGKDPFNNHFSRVGLIKYTDITSEAIKHKVDKLQANIRFQITKAKVTLGENRGKEDIEFKDLFFDDKITRGQKEAMYKTIQKENSIALKRMEEKERIEQEFTEDFKTLGPELYQKKQAYDAAILEATGEEKTKLGEQFTKDVNLSREKGNLFSTLYSVYGKSREHYL